MHLPLDQNDLVGGHALHVLPLVVGVIPHHERLPFCVGVLQNSGHEVGACVDRAEVAEREWVVERGVFNGTPEVDNLESALEKRVRVRRDVPADSGDGRRLCLVDVNTRDRLARLRGVVGLSRATTTYGCSNIISTRQKNKKYVLL